MAHTIRITDKYVYLDEVSITHFVKPSSIVVNGEEVSLTLMGEIQDERSTNTANMPAVVFVATAASKWPAKTKDGDQ